MADESIPPREYNGPSQRLLDIKQTAVFDCRIFYAGQKKSPGGSLICFSWECGPGWNDVIARLSYRIESLNLLYYRKYRVRCEAEQIKEKFGTLCVYARVAVDPPAWRLFLPNMLHRIEDWMAGLNVDFGMKKVIDRKRHIEYEYEQMTKEDFDRAERGRYRCSNVEYMEDSGRYYKVTTLDRYEKSHREPTKNKLFYALMNALRRVSGLLYAWAVVEHTREQRVIYEFFNREVEKYIREAEDECYNRCEECGRRIGEEQSPRCETKGWVTYLCEDCAKRRGVNYIKREPGKDCSEHENKD